MSRLIDADALLERENNSFLSLQKVRQGYEIRMIIHCALREIVNAAPTIQQPEWISCAERLPTKEDANEYNEVLCIDRFGRRTVCQFWEFNSSYKPVRWMPFSALPQPPKEGE